MANTKGNRWKAQIEILLLYMKKVEAQVEMKILRRRIQMQQKVGSLA